NSGNRRAICWTHIQETPMTTPTANALDTKLTLAIGLAHRNGYELPDSATVARAARFLNELGTRIPSLAGTADVAIGPDGAIEFLLTTSWSIVSVGFETGEEQTEIAASSGDTLTTVWIEADEPLLTVVTEQRVADCIGDEEQM